MKIILLVAAGALLAIIIAVALVAVVIKKSLKSSGIGDIFSAVKQADADQMSTPKSLSGTEPVYRDMILKDFPEFGIELARSYIKGFLPEYFHAVSSGDVLGIRDNCTSQFADSLESGIASKRLEGAESDEFTAVKVHKVVISGYKRTNEEALITFEAAVEYRNGGRLSQHKYKILYVYFLQFGSRGENESLKCQNCGAPITSIGVKVCPACGEAIEASIERTWKITDVICEI